MKSNLFIAFFLTSCSALTPDLYKAVDDIETDTVVRLEMNKEAFQEKDADVEINISIKKKDQ